MEGRIVQWQLRRKQRRKRRSTNLRLKHTGDAMSVPEVFCGQDPLPAGLPVFSALPSFHPLSSARHLRSHWVRPKSWLGRAMAWMIGTVGIMMGTFVAVLGGNEAQVSRPYRQLGVFVLVMAVVLMVLTLINALILTP